MYNYDFDEYENFVKANGDKKVWEAAFTFLNRHEENSIKKSDAKYYRTVLKSKKHLLSVYDFSIEEDLINEIKIFSYNLNHEKSIRSKLDSNNISNLRKLSKKSNMDYKKSLKSIYEKSAYRKDYTYEVTLKFLCDVFNGKTMQMIEKNIKSINVKPIKKVNKNSLDDYFKH